jgi:hypothetical protein
MNNNDPIINEQLNGDELGQNLSYDLFEEIVSRILFLNKNYSFLI